MYSARRSAKSIHQPQMLYVHVPRGRIERSSTTKPKAEPLIVYVSVSRGYDCGMGEAPSTGVTMRDRVRLTYILNFAMDCAVDVAGAVDVG